MRTIAEVILETIKNKGLRQQFVSQKTNISETNLSLSLKGKRQFKSSELIALSLFLGLTFNDFEDCQIG